MLSYNSYRINSIPLYKELKDQIESINCEYNLNGYLCEQLMDLIYDALIGNQLIMDNKLITLITKKNLDSRFLVKIMLRTKAEIIDNYSSEETKQIGRAIDLIIVSLTDQLFRQMTQADLELKSLKGELDRRIWELSVLSLNSTFINSSLDLPTVFDSIIEQIASIMGTGMCAIFGITDDGNNLNILAHRGLNSMYAMSIKIPIGQDGGGEAVQKLKPVVIENIEQLWTDERTPNHILPVKEHINYKAILSVPMFCKEKVLGCISVYHPHSYQFSESEQSILYIFANQAAVAIENARLYETASQLARVKERNRIARDLHDSVCQSMFSLVLNTEVCSHQLSKSEFPKAVDTINKMKELAKDTLNEMRSLIVELRPIVLKEQGLIKALQNHINVISKRNQIVINFSSQENRRLSEELELCLYRIAQEAITNVIKHANAQNIDIDLSFSPEAVAMTIKDDGCGFIINEVQTKHQTFGLHSMIERVESLGGSLVIDSFIRSGTIVSAKIPIWRG